ncbi:hypothetical protein WEI85_11595 [Actinomycetes bacterium KLBMP 9797]
MGRLTLVTADGDAYTPWGVLWVDADLTSPVQPAPPLPLGARALSTSEQALTGEPEARLTPLMIKASFK